MRVDGDYDILWKDFKHEKAKVNGQEEEISSILAENIEDAGKTKDEKNNELEVFGNRFRKLQIAVQIHCENWDVENYEPIVTYIPAEFDEKTHKSVDAFDSNGKKIKLGLSEIPDRPIIVVGLNERSDDDGNILEEYQLKSASLIPDPPGDILLPLPDFIPAPINVTGSTGNFSIYIQWSMPTGTYFREISGYKIYRKKEGATYFGTLPIGTNHSPFDMVYYDTSALSNNWYTYRVVAFGEGGSSMPSMTVTVKAAGLPESVSNFTAVNNIPNEVLIVKKIFLFTSQRLLTSLMILKASFLIGTVLIGRM